jgi:pyruvate ferredoxin oxidoreductase alpha subunit
MAAGGLVLQHKGYEIHLQVLGWSHRGGQSRRGGVHSGFRLCAAAQGREAVRYAQLEGLNVGLVKVKSIRPFPEKEIREVLKKAKAVIVPEHNIVGWLAKEVKAAIPDNDKVIGGPRVYGGMTLPVELIMEKVYAAFGIKKEKKVVV